MIPHATVETHAPPLRVMGLLVRVGRPWRIEPKEPGQPLRPEPRSGEGGWPATPHTAIWQCRRDLERKSQEGNGLRRWGDIAKWQAHLAMSPLAVLQKGIAQGRPKFAPNGSDGVPASQSRPARAADIP